MATNLEKHCPRVARLSASLRCVCALILRLTRGSPQASRRWGNAVPKTAWYAVVADPEGNIFAVWQADSNAMPMPEPD